jgi:translation initiation factor IF-2
MNNGKVRIYELSRELNLDNKDILAVCEGLNISVKSHSSTITESDAERIRKTAEKYVASHSAPGKPAPPDRANAPHRDSGNRSNDPKKQQILEIRRPKVRPGANSKHSGNEENTNVQPATATPPKLPTNQQQSPAPAKPNINRRDQSRPNVNPPVVPSENPSDDQGEVDQAAVNVNLRQNAHAEVRTAIAESVVVPQNNPAPTQGRPISSPPPPQPKLTSPPVRPDGNPNRVPGNQGNRPVLKGAKTESETAEVGQTSSQPARPSRPSRGVGKSEAQTNEGARPRRDGERPGRPQQATELRRPGQGRNAPAVASAIAPNRRGVDPTANIDENEEQDEDQPLVEISLLDRPTLPRPAKKAPVWEEDDEENPDFPNKSAKVAAKAKRSRVKPLIDDDDDDVDNLEMPEPIVVSLSLARPAKPKGFSAPKAATPLATPGPSGGKNKKPGAAKDAASGDRNQRGNNRRQATEVKAERPEKLILSGSMTVQELALALAVAETEIIRRLFSKGMAVSITETLDISAIHIVAEELGVPVETAEKEAEAKKIIEMLSEEDLDNLQRRPPVVTIMGHVDHGKTTLLDSIRKTKVAQGEAGGITQHIGAYHVDVTHDGKMQQVVFLDTPGHEAFTAMRARGARVTDVAVLVVAADDGVRPQTIEAISHAKAAQVPMVVAINKVDKEGAQPERVKQELTQYGLVAEDWGGDTIMVPVSAIKGENLDTLLEMILLVSEVADLQANPNRAAKGTVIEANLDKARGPVATLLIQNGTLRVGDVVVAGSALGKVRAMIDDRGKRVDVAGPSFAVEILGLRDVPRAGDEFDVYPSEKEAAAIAGARVDRARESRLLQGRISLSGFSQQAKEGELKELNLILKGDVQGSVEAIVGALRQLPQKEVQLRLLLAAPGEITETDIDLAAASAAVIIGFNTTLASGARQAADREGVDVREYNIIYNLLDDVQGAMEGLLEPELVEEPLGNVEVRAVFPISRGAVAGCYVLSGKIIRNCKVRVRRGSNVLYEGVLDSLKRMKDDVKEVNAGYECGISLNAFSGWAEGDMIESYRMVTKRRTLST